MWLYGQRLGGPGAHRVAIRATTGQSSYRLVAWLYRQRLGGLGCSRIEDLAEETQASLSTGDVADDVPTARQTVFFLY